MKEQEKNLELTAPIFNIQSYSIHDGPGIRVTVFVKGCPLRCLWCANPESNLAQPQLMTYLSKCVGCGACLQACPQGAICMEPGDGKMRAVTDRTRCMGCGACEEACPHAAREIVGKPMTVRDVLNKVLRDKLFIDDSGGGITLSGGECLMHPAFSETLLCEAKACGLHTAVESSCFAPREVIDRVFRFVDLGLLDVKHMDPNEHKKCTGVSNELILNNIRHIYHDLHIPVAVRVPTIPGCNDSDENIAATARFAALELGQDVTVHLLPYHKLGESKSESLGMDKHLSFEVPSDAHMQHLKALVESYGVKAQIGG